MSDIKLPVFPINKKPDMVLSNGKTEIYYLNPEALPAAKERMIKKAFKLYRENPEWKEAVESKKTAGR
jgi:hypothetical protein